MFTCFLRLPSYSAEVCFLRDPWFHYQKYIIITIIIIIAWVMSRGDDIDYFDIRLSTAMISAIYDIIVSIRGFFKYMKKNVCIVY